MASATEGERGVPLSALCPKFLHSNSTSHTWPFSAMAELIDNAYDPDVNANQFWIDITQVNNEDILTFTDNGNGLDYEKMHKMLSFGYSDKIAVNGKHPIGVYGNGFKSGSMRLGRDALVLSKSKDAVCVGMLSQSYLEAIKAVAIVVPIVSFQCSSHSSDGSLTWDQLHASDNHKASLEDILKYSLFHTEEELLTELKVIVSTCSTGATGTRIIIWNLRRRSSEQTEYCLKDRYDIRIPSDVYETEKKTYKRPERHQNSTPDTDLSLRAYCAVLYLKPHMHIIIRGQKVKSQLISKSLAHTVKDKYRPSFLKNKSIPITFGYNTKSKDHYGMMMYHKNRLIKAYERVGCQNQANNKGVGVIGVIECNFLDPTHNKQDFDNTDSYRKTMNNLALKLEEYWTEMKHNKVGMDPDNNAAEDIEKRPDQTWVQCDKCRKWRKLPDGIECSRLPEEWYCALNPDPQFRSCLMEQEREDSEDDEPYQKTYKLQKKKQQEENARKKKEEELKKAEQERVRLTEARRKKLKEMTRRSAVRSPDVAGLSPTGRAMRAMARDSLPLVSPQPSTSSLPDASAPSCEDLPIISQVFSLSTPSRKKRTVPKTLARENKRPRLNGTHGNTAGPDPPALEESSSGSSLTAIEPSDHEDNDVIVILDTSSTPTPNSSVDCAKVKLEQSSLSMESDDAAADGLDTPPNNATSFATAMDPNPLFAYLLQTVQASITIQTESPTKVKEEPEGRGIKEELDRDGQEEKTDQGMRRGQEETTEQREPRAVEPWCSMEVAGDASAHPNHANHMEENEALSGTEKGTLCPGPSGADAQVDFQNMAEAQKQQDQLLELLQTAAQERDRYREQVQKLTSQLQRMESSQQQLHQNPVRTEHSHQACQTEGQGGEGAEGRQEGGEGEQEAGSDGQFYKRLYEQAKLEAEQLRREKEAMLAGSHGKSSTTLNEVESPVSNEIAQQVDFLLQCLDKKNEETDHLQNRVQSLKEEKTNLISHNKRMQRDLEKQREEADREGVVTGPGSGGNQTGAARPEGVDKGESGTVLASEGAERLRNLRMKVGLLLASIFPEMDLKEVNYECDYIDDMVEMVLPNVASTTLGGGGTGC